MVGGLVLLSVVTISSSNLHHCPCSVLTFREGRRCHSKVRTQDTEQKTCI